MIKTTMRKYFKMIWRKLRIHMKLYRSSFWLILFKLMLFMEEQLDKQSDFKPNNPIDQFEGDINFGIYEFEYCVEFTSLIRDNILSNMGYPITEISISLKSEEMAPLHKIIFENCIKKCGLKLYSCEIVLDEVVFTILII